MAMTRPAGLGLIVVGVCAALLAVVGCNARSNSNGAKRGPVAAIPPKAAPVSSGAEAKPFAHWPTPAGALIISGQQNGYLEPCGCTKGQRGGLARRMDLVEKLRAQGWPLALIDLGSLINDPNTAGGPVETRLRYSVALKGLEAIGYDAVALSTTDFKLGVSEVLTAFLNHEGDKLRMVSANVTPEASLGLADRVVPSVRAQTGPIKIGITAVIDLESYDKLDDPAKSEMLSFRNPDEVLPEVLADLERDTHMQVLMVQGSPESARRLAQGQPGFEVVVATSPYVDPPRDAETLNGGKTQLISVGQKGQYVGVLGLYQDPKQKFRYQRVELNYRYNDKTEAMRKLIDEDFQADLRQADVLTTYPRRAYVFTDSPSDATYVGAETCKACHPNTYAKWATTKHARAYTALTSNPKRNREFDAQCVSCHTTGFEYHGGFVRADLTPNLKGNQCENCHGPGSKHAADPTNPAILATVRRSAADFDKNHRCIKCHTEDDSPNFDFAQYWPQVVHKGLDTYNDPKVKQGITPAEVARQDRPASR
jgi:hypothetical protein